MNTDRRHTDNKTEKKETGLEHKPGGRSKERPRRSWVDFQPVPPSCPSVPPACPGVMFSGCHPPLLSCLLPYSLVMAVGSGENPAGVYQDTPALIFGESVHSYMPGLGILLTFKSSDNPRLDGRYSICNGQGGRGGLAQIGRCTVGGHS